MQADFRPLKEAAESGYTSLLWDCTRSQSIGLEPYSTPTEVSDSILTNFSYSRPKEPLILTHVE